MKRLVLFILISGTITLIVKAVPDVAKTCYITGNVEDDRTRFLIFQTFDKFLLAPSNDTIAIDNNGMFVINWLLGDQSPKAYLIFNENRTVRIYGYPGGNLDINYKNDNKVEFGGTLAQFSQYYYEEPIIWKDIYDKQQKKTSGFNDDSFVLSDRYFQFTDSVTVSRIHALQSFFGNNRTIEATDFVASEKRNLVSINLYYKTNYANVDLNKFGIFAPFAAPGEFTQNPYGFTTSVSFDDRQNYKNSSFHDFAISFFTQCGAKKFIERKHGGPRSEFIGEVFGYIDALSHDPFCNTLLKTIFLNKELSFSNSYGVDRGIYEPFIQGLLSTPETHYLVSFIKRKFESASSKTETADLSSVLFADSTGDLVSLKNFEGKFVYVNLWASWCGPCIRKIPAWNELLRRYNSSERITFLSISIDRDRQQWLRALKRFGIMGNHLITTDGDGMFKSLLKIESIPRMLLISPDGSVADFYANGPEDIDLSKLK